MANAWFRMYSEFATDPNHWNRLAGLANVGQSTASNLASLGQNYANNVSNNLIGAANSRASAYGAKADAWGSALADWESLPVLDCLQLALSWHS